MHLNAPKMTVTSVRDFAGKYAMFVLSILTALMLEHLGQKLYHYKIASEATVKIDEELRANLTEIRQAKEYCDKEFVFVDGLVQSLGKDIKDKLSDDDILRRFKAASKGRFGLNLVTPTLRREAWEVAVANQSASHMPAEALTRYSTAYALLRDEQANTPTMLQVTVDGPRMLNVQGDLALDKATPLEVFHVVMQIRTAVHAASNNAHRAEKELSALIK